ncbi:tetratricopeptide repeat-containing sulfotransferase family protein [Sagittula sp. SSi028]|uniref:tetratricopeptide repeat-containing sulfotransferase family protein n=1 Tax=Sagittula sp. SSi028 TaxID=3400636 RepID=UPI003AF5106C
MTPSQIKAQFDQAQSMIRTGQPDKAAALLRSLLLPTGHAPEVNFQLARALDRLGDSPAAAKAIDAALTKRPDSPALIDLALQIFDLLGDTDRVLALHDARIALAPKDIKPRADKALALQRHGRFDEAETLLRKLLKKHPQESELYRMLFAVTKAFKGEPLLAQARKLWSDKRLNDHGRMNLGFALAKAAEDTGANDQVFRYLDAANAAQARLAPADMDARAAEWQAYQRAQDGADLSPPTDTAELSPVFVTGMPRSGTTLVEQIIAAHPQATAGGEMGHALRESRRLFGTADQMPHLDAILADQRTAFADSYARLVRRETQATQGVVTDKSIRSQLIFGLIAACLPQARLIVVHRDPRDIALSIYRNAFRLGTHRYANDLGHIATEIKAFRAQVAWWQEQMPGRIHTIHYEDLVSDPDPQARALIDAAGLLWDDRCLAFHTQNTSVKTLSLAQVRQPIHTGRRAAWRRYADELAPFITAWGDTPWD